MVGGSGYNGPSVDITIENDDVTPSTATHTWFHFKYRDEYVDCDGTLHPYIFDRERDRFEDEMQAWVREQRANFQWAAGVVWPDELDGVVQDCDGAVMADLEWVLVTAPWTEVDGDDLRELAIELQREVDERGS